MKYLLDTMIVSEPGKLRPSPAVIRWLGGIDPLDAATSALTLGEIEAGIVAVTDPMRRRRLEVWLEQDVLRYFRNRILPLDAEAARVWARLRHKAPSMLPVVDSLIAAIAMSRNLTIVTR